MSLPAPRGLDVFGSVAAHLVERTFPRLVADGLLDPVRRRNLAARLVEAAAGAAAALVAGAAGYALVGWPGVALGLLAGPAVEFVVYECWLEPRGWTGHYWERGPRDGERFTRL